MPLPPCDKILQIILPAYLQLQSPYYFQKVVWSLSLDYFIPCSTLYVPCVTSSFIQIIFFATPLPSQEWNMEMCLSKYVDDVSLCRITISSTFHDRTPCSDVLGFCLFFMYLSGNRDSRLREWWITPNVRGLTWTTHWIFHTQVLLLSISLATVKKQYYNCPLM